MKRRGLLACAQWSLGALSVSSRLVPIRRHHDLTPFRFHSLLSDRSSCLGSGHQRALVFCQNHTQKPTGPTDPTRPSDARTTVHSTCLLRVWPYCQSYQTNRIVSSDSDKFAYVASTCFKYCLGEVVSWFDNYTLSFLYSHANTIDSRHPKAVIG